MSLSPWMHCIDQATIVTEYMSPLMHCIYQATCISSRIPLLQEDRNAPVALLLLVGLLQGAHLQEAHCRRALVETAASPAWPWPSAMEHSVNYKHHKQSNTHQGKQHHRHTHTVTDTEQPIAICGKSGHACCSHSTAKAAAAAELQGAIPARRCRSNSCKGVLRLGC